MKLQDKILKIVEKNLEGLQNYTEMYNTQVKAKRETLINSNKEKFKKDPSSVDLEDIAKNIFYLNGFHQLDIRKLQSEFLNSYNLYKKLKLETPLSKEADAVAATLKSSLGTQMFVVEGGEFKELVSGNIEEAMKKYQKNNYFKLFEAQLVKLLNE